MKLHRTAKLAFLWELEFSIPDQEFDISIPCCSLRSPFPRAMRFQFDFLN